MVEVLPHPHRADVLVLSRKWPTETWRPAGGRFLTRGETPAGCSPWWMIPLSPLPPRRHQANAVKAGRQAAPKGKP
jgi:hypothetical protein